MIIADLDDFKKTIDGLGFDTFWSSFIQSYLAEKRPDLQKTASELVINFTNSIFDFDNIGELYEIALEYTNQQSKKTHGQYYTPKDVCEFMAKKFIALRDDNQSLADVCCGTGNLIIEVLSLLKKEQVKTILENKQLYLYDLDRNALRLAIMKICILFIPKNDTGLYHNISKTIQYEVGNFLKEDIVLPKKCIVISNPPYAKLPHNIEVWKSCKTLETNDLYSIFIEKIATQADGAVIISPQSFLGSSKFKILRKVLSNFGGNIWSFDNVPATIFCGRKKGIFNTNTANSVRAAITVIDKKENGFRVSPMIRFRANERSQLFPQLDKLLGDIRYFNDTAWTKIPKTLEPLVSELRNTKQTVNDLIENNATKQETSLKITVPSTPRYFITGSKRELGRSSKIEIFAKNQESFDKLYLMINSTISYLWWRIYDGGITLTKSTLLAMPVPNLSTEKMSDLVKEGINMEDDFVVNKLNAGKNNENIKLPDEYRKKVNDLILHSINSAEKAEQLFSIHFNSLAKVMPMWII
jgi:hypothetical protein